MPFLKVFDIIPGWVWALVVAGALAAGFGLYGVEVVAHSGTKVKLAEQITETARKENERATVAQEAAELRAEVSELRAKEAQEINDEVQAEKQRTAAAVAGESAAKQRLLELTAESNRPSSSEGSGDPKALRRAEERAAAFGGLLATCDAVAESLGRDVEDLATQVRGLIRSYDSLGLRPITTALDPFADREQVDPGPRLRWDGVVDATGPDAASEPRVDLGLGLVRVVPQVGP
jgi:hypothetical protein